MSVHDNPDCLFFTDKSYNPHPFCMVVYYIPEGFTPKVMPHGNSKSELPYFGTLPSTFKAIQEKCCSLGPKAVVASVGKSVGGILNANYPGELPRNESQVSNYKRQELVNIDSKTSISKGNELYAVMLQAHHEDKDKKFIRDVKIFPEPAIVLATDQQLYDIERFCCNPKEFSVLTVDPTFTLGDFDVTPTTYRNLLLECKRTRKSPVMLGPTLVHYRKTFSTYLFFASCMISLNKNLKGLCAFGADGEAALTDAFCHEFPEATRLTCFNHVRRNIKDEMHKLAIPEELQSEVLNDIFGKRVGSTLLTGLVDSQSVTAFENKLAHLMKKWLFYDHDEEEEGNLGSFTQFCSWFGIYKKEIIRDTMLLPVCEQAGLGSPPDPFYNNASECINNVIKVKVDYKKNELPVFISKVLDLIEEQQQEAEKAVLGNGKYVLRCSSLEVPQQKWYTMSREMRKQHLKRFNNASITCLYEKSLKALKSSSAEMTTHSQESSNGAEQYVSTNEKEKYTASPSALSISILETKSSTSSKQSSKEASLSPTLPGPSSSSISVQPDTSVLLYEKLAPLSSRLGLPTEAIRGIANKAIDILKEDGAIANAPGHPNNAKMVISRSGKRPHLVLPKKKSGGLSCDDDCPQYKSAKLCSHIVAAAHYNGELDSFIDSYRTTKTTPNLTKLATSTMPKGRGRKGSRAPTKRKQTIPIQDRIELHPTVPEKDVSLNASMQIQVSASSASEVSVSPVYNTPTLAHNANSTNYPWYPNPLFYSSPMLFPSPYPPMPSSTHCPPTINSTNTDPTSNGMYPFRVHFISGNISVCNGCKGRYRPLGAPYDICLQHEEWRVFTPQGLSRQQSRFGNVYYHCSVPCVQAVWPSFVPCSVVVPHEMKACLQPEHIDWLFVNFGVTV